MPLVTPRPAPAPSEPAAAEAEPAPPEPATQSLPTVTPRAASQPDDTVILPALRGRTTKQSREHPPTNLHRQEPPKPRDEPGPREPKPRDEPAAALPVPPNDLDKPQRRGPSRAMIAIVVAVVLVLAAAWLLVSLPGTPGGADWAGDSGRNWPPDAPSGSPGAAASPSAPPASAPFVSPAPGQVADNGLPPGLLPSPIATGPVAAAPPAAGTPSSNAPSSPPVGGTPTTTPLLDGGTAGSGQVEAEAFAWQWGVVSTALDGASGGRGVSGIANGDWLRFDGVNLTAANTLKVRIANGSNAGGRIEVRYDSPWAAPAASVSVDNTGGWAQWRTRSVSCGTADGPRTVFVSFVSRGSGDFVYLDWISFS